MEGILENGGLTLTVHMFLIVVCVSLNSMWLCVPSVFMPVFSTCLDKYTIKSDI